MRPEIVVLGVNMDAESFYLLTTKYLSAETTLEETELMGLYLEDEYYLELFLKINDAWIKAGNHSDQHQYDPERGIALLRAQTLGEKPEPEKIVKLYPAWRKYVGYAAALSTVMLAVFFYLYLQHKPEPMLTVQAKPGTIRWLKLPDGSAITLNAGSTLSYPRRFKGKTREVFLTGEALFKVKSDREHPFIAEANGYATKAVGTVFNIKAFPEEDHVSIALLKGKVLISNRNHTLQDLVLSPSQILYADVNTGQTSIETLNTDQVLSWSNSKLSFQQAPFAEVVNSISRKYNIQMKYDHERFKHCKVTANFSNETIHEVLEALKFALQFNYKTVNDRQSGQYIIINGSGC